MPNRIGPKKYKAAFQYAIRVLTGEFSPKEAIAGLRVDVGMNANSARDYFYAVWSMLGHANWGHTINGEAFRYYLETIYSSMGEKGLRVALEAFDKHSNNNSNPQQNLKVITEKFYKKLQLTDTG
jgi:hypothetical protein